MNQKVKATEIKIVYKSKVKPSDRPKIHNSADSFKVFNNHFDQETIELKESAWAMYLNTANKVLAVKKLSEGTVNATLLDPKTIFQGALMVNATAVILAHNHPSGNLKPSTEDIKHTIRIKEAGKVLDIFVVDHLIITGEGKYTSLSDSGYIY